MMLEHPTDGGKDTHTGALAAVQHSGGWSGEAGANEQAGPSSNGAKCAKAWVGQGAWDVITVRAHTVRCATSSQLD